jgi:hypothetical protein
LDGRQLRVEAFFRRYSNLPDRSTSDDPRIIGDEFESLRGSSKGVDLLLRPRLSSAWQGWMAYTLAFSERRDQRGAAFTPAHDRRHEFNLVAIRQLGAWSASTRFNLASGTPFTPLRLEFEQRSYDPATNTWGRRSTGLLGDETQYVTGQRNSTRLPLAHRLDVGMARTGRRGDARSVPYFSIANAYGALNPWIRYDRFDERPERLELSSFRFLPTFGFKYVF